MSATVSSAAAAAAEHAAIMRKNNNLSTAAEAIFSCILAQLSASVLGNTLKIATGITSQSALIGCTLINLLRKVETFTKQWQRDGLKRSETGIGGWVGVTLAVLAQKLWLPLARVPCAKKSARELRRLSVIRVHPAELPSLAAAEQSPGREREREREPSIPGRSASLTCLLFLRVRLRVCASETRTSEPAATTSSSSSSQALDSTTFRSPPRRRSRAKQQTTTERAKRD